MILRNKQEKPLEAYATSKGLILRVEIAGFEPTYIAHKYKLQSLLMTNSVTIRLHFYLLNMC